MDLWQWGWTKSAETWNGRLAMVGILAIIGLELATGQSFLRQYMAYWDITAEF